MSEELSLPPPSLEEENVSTTSSSSSFVPIEFTTQDAIQVINEHKEFNDGILEYIKTTAPVNSEASGGIGNNYHIISVFGSQSTGKSTLLNKLFNTNFDVMDETNRQQTTKGIWMAYSPHISTTKSALKQTSNQLRENVFVMDVEGTDGRERGEDQDFERKAALFALSTSEILIINTWEQQIGLYQGANMGLLKTVFEVNLSLFGKSKLDSSNDHKVLLLFVIRDHIGNTSKESLANTIKASLSTIWESLNKPVELQKFQFEDFFDLAFHTLSHKVLQADLFTTDVEQLGDKLIDVNDTEYLFKPEYHHSIPIDGWTMYAQQCWQQIDSNKDLDLPTQQILVAKFKCDEISNTVYEEFLIKYKAKIQTPTKDLKSTDVDYEEIGLYMNDLFNDTLEDYDISASRYNNSVYEQKRLTLVSKLIDAFKENFDLYIQHLIDALLISFKDSLRSKSKSLQNTQFANLVKLLKSKFITDFNAKALLISLEGKLQYTNYEKTLSTKFDEIIAQQQVNELNNIVNKSTKKLGSGLNKFVIQELSEPDESSWDKILAKFNETLKEILVKYEVGDEGDYDFGLGTSEELTRFTIDSIKFKSWTKFHEIVKKYISRENFLNILKERFEDKFRYDENGLPRLYQNVHELEINFKKSKDFALRIVPFVTIAKLSDDSEILPDFNVFDKHLQKKFQSVTINSLEIEENPLELDSDSDEDEEDYESNFAILISETDKALVLSKFKRETDAVFVETNRSIVQHVTQIPYYIYLVILVLGWNEFLAVIRNPLLFLLILISCAGVYLLYTLNLLRPATIVIQKFVDECVAQGKAQLKQWLVDDHGMHANNLGKISGGRGGKEPVEEIELDDLSPADSE